MKKFCIVFCMLVFTAAVLFFVLSGTPRGIKDSPVSPTGAKVNGKQWIFIIGIDSYQKWSRLDTAVNDAKSVKDILLERYCYDQKNLIELYNEKATRKNILKKFRYLAKELDNDDSLLIYYAGHGHIDSITKAGSWIPVESGIDDSSTWITNHDILNYLRFDVIKAKHILLVSDSCFSGNFFRGHSDKLLKGSNTAIKKAWQLTSRQAVTSGSIKPVSDAEFGKNSVFSHFFLKTLKENRKSFLVPSDFFPDIKAGVIENADRVPQLGSLEDNGGRQGGEYVFFLKQDSSADVTKINTEIIEHERELAALDAKIEAMENRMSKMMDQTYGLKQKINELKYKIGVEQAKRRDEIARYKREKLTSKKETIPPLSTKKALDSIYKTPSISVGVKDFSASHDPENNILRVRFLINNLNTTPGNISGRIFVVLKPDNSNQDTWLVIPSVNLTSGKPSDIKRGQFFKIRRFKSVNLLATKQTEPEKFILATIFVFTTTGELVLEKDIPVSIICF